MEYFKNFFFREKWQTQSSASKVKSSASKASNSRSDQSLNFVETSGNCKKCLIFPISRNYF